MIHNICKLKIKSFNIITVTDRGQIAIPVGLREELGIKKGDKLIIVKRDDKKGFNLLRVDVIGNFLEKISKN